MSETVELTIPALAKKTYMRPAQRDQLRSSVRSLENQLRGISDFPGALPGDTLPSGGQTDRVIDVEVVRENLERDRLALERGTPPKLSGKGLRDAISLEKKLRMMIPEGMPSDEQMNDPTAKNVETHMAWQGHNKERILAWRTLRKLIDPSNDNPNFTSVEIFRPVKPSYVDWGRYWKNFPDFSEDVEDQLAEIDDSLIMQIAGYVTLGWAARSIQRKLNISQDQYRLGLKAIKEMRKKTEADDVEVEAIDLDPFPTIQEELGWEPQRQPPPPEPAPEPLEVFQPEPRREFDYFANPEKQVADSLDTLEDVGQEREQDRVALEVEQEELESERAELEAVLPTSRLSNTAAIERPLESEATYEDYDFVEGEDPPEQAPISQSDRLLEVLENFHEPLTLKRLTRLAGLHNTGQVLLTMYNLVKGGYAAVDEHKRYTRVGTERPTMQY